MQLGLVHVLFGGAWVLGAVCGACFAAWCWGFGSAGLSPSQSVAPVGRSVAPVGWSVGLSVGRVGRSVGRSVSGLVGALVGRSVGP